MQLSSLNSSFSRARGIHRHSLPRYVDVFLYFSVPKRLGVTLLGPKNMYIIKSMFSHSVLFGVRGGDTKTNIRVGVAQFTHYFF